MTAWRARLHGDPLPWLLEPDEVQPAVRCFALRDLLDEPETGRAVRSAKQAVMATGPVPAILANQAPEGYWVKPGPGYYQKYRSTAWQVILLAHLGADGAHSQVNAACEYILSHARASNGGFSTNATPSMFVHCLAGNLEAALIDLGWLNDPRLQAAMDWQARTITGDGVAPPDQTGTPKRYYLSGTSGPLFSCAINGRLPCAWGGVKALLAFSKVPKERRTPAVRAAISAGTQFLLSKDPAVADYPFGYGARPSGNWFRFGYPLGFVADVLQNLEVLAALGHARDARLARAVELVESKQDAQGRWKLESTFNGKMWIEIETKGAPSKWVTLRALRVLRAAYGD